MENIERILKHKYLIRNLPLNSEDYSKIQPKSEMNSTPLVTFVHDGSRFTKKKHAYLALTKSVDVIIKNNEGNRIAVIDSASLINSLSNEEKMRVFDNSEPDLACTNFIKQDELKRKLFGSKYKYVGAKTERYLQIAYRTAHTSKEVDLEGITINQEHFELIDIQSVLYAKRLFGLKNENSKITIYDELHDDLVLDEAIRFYHLPDEVKKYNNEFIEKLESVFEKSNTTITLYERISDYIKQKERSFKSEDNPKYTNFIDYLENELNAWQSNYKFNRKDVDNIMFLYENINIKAR